MQISNHQPHTGAARATLRAVALIALFVPVAGAAPARAEPKGRTRQATASSGDTTLQRFGPEGSRSAALRSSGDPVPASQGGPGNADLSTEVYRLNVETLELVQCTASAGNSSSVKVTAAGDVIVASNENLTPAAFAGTGNTDGSYECWYFDGPAQRLRQITQSAGDTFFQTFWDERRRAFFVSRGDLTPGLPGNTGGANQVFDYDVDRDRLIQLTEGLNESLIRSICRFEGCGLIQSSADFTGGNADGSAEIFFLDIDGGNGFRQATDSLANSVFRGQSTTGRYFAVESRGDLVPSALGGPGNADGSLEVFVCDLPAKTVIQATASSGDSTFAGFVPHSHQVIVHSHQDLTPSSASSAGNADLSQEVFLVNLRTGATRQLTASDGDSSLADIGPRRGRIAAIRSTGDLRPDLPGGGSGTNDVYLTRLTKSARPFVPVVRGDASLFFEGFDIRGGRVAMDSTADLVPGGNADGSREVYLARTHSGRDVPVRLRQVTRSGADSRLGGFATDGQRLLIESRADLVPAGAGNPGNADGSWEVFVHRYR